MAQRGDALALEVVERGAPQDTPSTSVDGRITRALAEAGQHVLLAALRACCPVRSATLCERLALLTASGHLIRECTDHRLAGS